MPIGWQDEQSRAPIEQLLRNIEFTPFTAVANLTGLPRCRSRCTGATTGCPIGVQAIGPPAGDALLLRLAAQVEDGPPVGRPTAADRA